MRERDGRERKKEGKKERAAGRSMTGLGVCPGWVEFIFVAVLPELGGPFSYLSVCVRACVCVFSFCLVMFVI